MEKHLISHLREEVGNGLKIYVETAWGWSELKVGPFLRQAETAASAAVYGFSEVRRDGSITLKIPRRI